MTNSFTTPSSLSLSTICKGSRTNSFLAKKLKFAMNRIAQKLLAMLPKILHKTKKYMRSDLVGIIRTTAPLKDWPETSRIAETNKT